MGRDILFCFQPRRPLGFLKAYEDKPAGHKQRALDKHTVRGKKPQLLVLAHILILQAHGLIQQTACIEKLFYWQPAALMPFGQLFIRGVFRLDIAYFICGICGCA